MLILQTVALKEKSEDDQTNSLIYFLDIEIDWTDK